MRKWISVKERLPNECEYVWAAVRSLKDDREPWVVEVVYFTHRRSGPWDIPLVAWGDAEVYAWKPVIFPKPPRLEEML